MFFFAEFLCAITKMRFCVQFLFYVRGQQSKRSKVQAEREIIPFGRCARRGFCFSVRSVTRSLGAESKIGGWWRTRAVSAAGGNGGQRGEAALRQLSAKLKAARVRPVRRLQRCAKAIGHYGAAV